MSFCIESWTGKSWSRIRDEDGYEEIFATKEDAQAVINDMLLAFTESEIDDAESDLRIIPCD